MSTLTHGQRAAGAAGKRRSNKASAGGRRPYFVMNGAIMVSIAAIAITLIGILYLVQTSQVAQLGYEMSRLQDRHDSLTMEISDLQYEVARYESLQTVEDVARDRLGMTDMANYNFIEVQQPPSRELTPPEPQQFDSPSFLERVKHAVLGVGSANSQTADTAAGQETP